MGLWQYYGLRPLPPAPKSMPPSYIQQALRNLLPFVASHRLHVSLVRRPVKFTLSVLSMPATLSHLGYQKPAARSDIDIYDPLHHLLKTKRVKLKQTDAVARQCRVSNNGHRNSTVFNVHGGRGDILGSTYSVSVATAFLPIVNVHDCMYAFVTTYYST